MKKSALLASLRSAAFALISASAAIGTAHAGLVSGNWDPVFGGTALPNLSWQARTQWLVPNGCSNAADGVYSTTTLGSPCESTNADPVRLLAVFVRWFDTGLADPNDFYTFTANSAYVGFCGPGVLDPNCNFFWGVGGEPLTAAAIRVEQLQVVGFDTTPTVSSYLTFGAPPSAGANTYELSFTTNGPVFQCVTCTPPDIASTAGLDQFLITYTSNDTSTPKFTDANGNTLGAVLDGNGNYLGQRIPEPGALALALVALAGVGISRRRKQR